MSYNFDAIVVGSGITGLMSAYASAKAGQKTALIERNPNLGGIMRGFEWENTHFDFGCHLFGNDQNENTALIREILDDELSPVDLSVASIYQGKLTKGFELPDLTCLPQEVKDAFLSEAGQAATTPDSLEKLLQFRFGKTITPFLNEIIEKAFLKSPAQLGAQGSPATPFRRLRLFNDTKSRELKRDGKWDDLLAASPLPSSIPRAYYPKGTGVSYFIKKAEEKLKALNVTILTSSQINDVQKNDDKFTLTIADEAYISQQLIWTAGLVNLIQSTASNLDQTLDIETQIHRVPMVLYYYIFSKENEGDLAYLQCFDKAEPFYRMSVPGRYGDKNCQDGESYLCVEVPTEIDTPQWNRPENHLTELWEKACSYGLIQRNSTYLKATTKKTPVSYKMPLLGYEAAAEPLLDFARENGIILGDEWAFTKGNLMLKILDQINTTRAA